MMEGEPRSEAISWSHDIATSRGGKKREGGEESRGQRCSRDQNMGAGAKTMPGIDHVGGSNSRVRDLNPKP